ncbi:MAG TPA: hypothetical protein VGL81_34635 [Polyangiaceae bacterium]|jgi:hypothetical protein
MTTCPDRSALRFAVPAGLALAALLSSASASAQAEAPGYRGEAALYPIEIEPHFSFGAENVYGATGFGAGMRLSIPVIAGYLGRVPDNLAISFGGDFLHYDNCYFGNDCGANYLMLPVAAQWNIFVAHRVSIFGEGGVFVYKGFFNGCAPDGGPGCSPPSDFGILPTLAVGARFHLGRNASLTARLGYPTSTLGVSFL